MTSLRPLPHSVVAGQCDAEPALIAEVPFLERNLEATYSEEESIGNHDDTHLRNSCIVPKHGADRADDIGRVRACRYASECHTIRGEAPCAD